MRSSILNLRFLKRKSIEYTREIGLCLRAGKRLRDRGGLAIKTLRYHALKAVGIRHVGAPHDYAIRGVLPTRTVRLRNDSGDFLVFHEVFTNHVYFIPDNWLGDVRTVVDLGANIGLTTLYFASRYPNARFICLEPLPSNFEILHFNLQGVNDKVTLIQAAVLDLSGQADFEDTGNTYGGHLARIKNRPYATKQTIRVECISMEDLLVRSGVTNVDLLKIDIEGAEEILLAGSPPWLDRVKAIVIEIHGGYTIDRLRADLEPRGFIVKPQAELGVTNTIFAHRREDRLSEHGTVAERSWVTAPKDAAGPI